MANSVILKAKSVANLGTDVAFSAAIALNDGSKDIAATFSIETDEATLPMIGATEYGKIVGLVSDATTPFTVTATPLGDDGTNAIEVETTVGDLISANVGEGFASA